MNNTDNEDVVSDVTVRRAGENIVGAMGVQVSTLARGSDTANEYSLLEYVSPVGAPGPPPHWHKVARESFYILEGTLQFRIDDRSFEATVGTLVVVPPRTVHSWLNTGSSPARFLIMFSPAGFEDYFKELFEWVNSQPTWPPQDVSRMAALHAKYDTFSPPVV
ncbi:MAG TPA: cupin domain-containing protein [Abditibacteriaceae bacterium]|jgi:mannose-6-phosphate isomerase-like protein (cupin superfamily)